MKKKCLICKKTFQAKTNRSLYCSEECRKKGIREKQRKLMQQKRAEEKEKKKKLSNANTLSDRKPKKIRNLVQHYTKLKKEILSNEEAFGFIGVTLVEGVDVHEDDFVESVIQKIKEQK